jgi:hypothetical protein
MRQFTLVGVTATGGSALALSMVLTNFAYDAAGSVPDIEGCGFLAGSLICLALIFPVLAAFIAGRAATALIRRGANSDDAARAGGQIGGLGSGLYFGLGLLSLARSPYPITLNLIAVSAGMILLCTWAGKIGALLRIGALFTFFPRRSER